jgi:hypothetical protein
MSERNTAGRSDGFGNGSVRAVSADQGTVSAYAAQRGNVLTLVLINKSNTPVSVPVAGYSMSMLELPPSAD